MQNGNDPDHGLTGEELVRVLNTYLADPAAVEPTARAVLDEWIGKLDPHGVEFGASSEQTNGSAVKTATQPVDPAIISNAVAAAEAIRAYGHYLVPIDPIAPRPEPDERVALGHYNVSYRELAQLPASIVRGPLAEKATDARAAIQSLYRIYTTRVGYEFTHLTSETERQWLLDAIESEQFALTLAPADARQVIERLTRVEAFEKILHRAFVGQKRFSIEGLDVMVPMLDEIVSLAGVASYKDVILGMAHRGRLAVKMMLTGASFYSIFRAFAHAHGTGQDHGPDPGDVKYHLGATGHSSHFPNGPLVHLRPNPSHLEFVNPIVEGYTRALQEQRNAGGEPQRDLLAALPVLVHGDAAFPGEGIVSETLNIAGLAGFNTGGTLHIIANNNIGFTTDPISSRSTHYSSDLAKGFDIPVFHVNADDAEACIAVTRLAFAFREQFHRDVLIDLVGYRRWGHNEGDEPAYTQPLLYAKVNEHPTVRQIWASTLEDRGVLRPGEGDQLLAAADAELRESAEAAGVGTGHHENKTPGKRMEAAESGVPLETLQRYNAALLKRPEGFTPMAKLEQQLQRSRGNLELTSRIDWGHAESLAFASILAEGTPIRLSGQDAQRGTFAHRHAVLHDAVTGAEYTPLANLPDARASFAIHNSPLCEGAVLGFEYGYSSAAENALVIWEAQFGDFANVAQVLVDQFISADWAKWRQRSGLMLLLPHGYEGQGPEHSSGRIERYLQLFAEDNLRIAVPSTADQFFHLLRRQAAMLKEGDPRPLVVFTPKSLLRQPAAAAPVERLVHGSFQYVLDDPEAPQRASEVTRLVFCTGKIGIEMLNNPERAAARNVAIARIERLAPFPTGAVKQVIDGYPNLKEVVWVQEEPRNMGAWSFIGMRLWTMLSPQLPVNYIGRLDRASPAEGSQDTHAAEQARIIRTALKA